MERRSALHPPIARKSITMKRSVFAVAAVATFLAASEAAAHAKLVSANPAVGATGSAPRQIVLRFSEKLQPKFSAFDVTYHGAPVPMKTAVGRDRRTLVGAPTRPLARGAYQVMWHAVTADTHRIKGSYTFTVR